MRRGSCVGRAEEFADAANSIAGRWTGGSIDRQNVDGAKSKFNRLLTIRAANSAYLCISWLYELRLALRD